MSSTDYMRVLASFANGTDRFFKKNRNKQTNLPQQPSQKSSSFSRSFPRRQVGQLAALSN